MVYFNTLVVLELKGLRLTVGRRNVFAFHAPRDLQASACICV